MKYLHIKPFPHFDYTTREPATVAETADWAVIYKPAGIPSAPLRADEAGTAVSWFLRHEALKYGNTVTPAAQVCGKKRIEAGLLNRLDTDTRGLLLFAKNQAAYDFFAQAQKEDSIVKTYHAFTSPLDCVRRDIKKKKSRDDMVRIPQRPFILTSQFRNFGPGAKKTAPVFPDSRHYKAGKKDYSTIIEECIPYRFALLVRCRLNRGYRHQVRVHLAYLGYPIIGDPLYREPYYTGTTAKQPPVFSAHTRYDAWTGLWNEPLLDGDTAETVPLQLYATAISFPHPVQSGQNISVELPPPDKMNR